MGNKAAGIVGGVLVLVGVGLLFYFWFAVISPTLANMSASKGLSDLWMLDHIAYIVWCEDNGLDWQQLVSLLLYPDWIMPWYGPDPAVDQDFTLTLVMMLMVNGSLTTPSSVMGIPLAIFIYMLIGILGIGAILAFVGAGED